MKVVVSSAEFCILVTPADCGHDAVPAALCAIAPGGALARGAPMLLVSTPDEAGGIVGGDRVVENVHLQRVLKEIPAPSHPATLLAMMLLVMRHAGTSLSGWSAKVDTSVPLTSWSRMPPPLPLPPRCP